jgi:hypothetical protein
MSLIRTILTTGVTKAAKDRTKGRGLIATGVGMVATRIATRSVPGALLVFGGLAAKYLIDKGREARTTGPRGVDAASKDTPEVTNSASAQATNPRWSRSSRN